MIVHLLQILLRALHLEFVGRSHTRRYPSDFSPPLVLRRSEIECLLGLCISISFYFFNNPIQKPSLYLQINGPIFTNVLQYESGSSQGS